MENKIKRPPSVWITQILLLIFALIFLLPLVLLVFGGPLLVILIGLVIDLGIVALCLVAFWGLVKRRIYGRWLSVVLLSLFLLVQTLGQIFRPSGPLRYYEYTNSVQATTAVVLQILFMMLFFFLIYRLAFGSAANAFFAKPADE